MGMVNPKYLHRRKKSVDSINAKIQLVLKSGHTRLGYNSTLKSLRKGESKLILIANNCPPGRKSELEYLAMLSKISVHDYAGTNVDLGTICGKRFRVCSIAITNSADSDITSDIVKQFNSVNS